MGFKDFFGDLIPKKQDDEYNEEEEPIYNPFKVSATRSRKGGGPEFVISPSRPERFLRLLLPYHL